MLVTNIYAGSDSASDESNMPSLLCWNTAAHNVHLCFTCESQQDKRNPKKQTHILSVTLE